LLEGEIPINGNEDLKLRFRQRQELTVLDDGPTHPRDCLDLMRTEFFGEASVNTLV
jgi:hypothetical protein